MVPVSRVISGGAGLEGGTGGTGGAEVVSWVVCGTTLY